MKLGVMFQVMDATATEPGSAEVSRIAAYRAACYARRALAAGCTVAELLARGEAAAAETRRWNALRYDRAEQWQALRRKAAAHRRGWTVLA